MANVIHGELKFDSRSICQISDLMEILVTNGYTVEIKPDKLENGNHRIIYVTVMTEVN